jgi:predicted amidophosphoribosyltransferase
MKVCPNGHRPVLQIFKYCIECGAELVEDEDRSCPKCATPIVERQKYCGGCGFRLRDG